MNKVTSLLIAAFTSVVFAGSAMAAPTPTHEPVHHFASHQTATHHVKHHKVHHRTEKHHKVNHAKKRLEHKKVHHVAHKRVVHH